jgi:hypothetical protein
MRPKWRFTGLFGTPNNGRLEIPILFLNNRLDPVCPLRSAYAMAKAYEGSVVLEQSSAGHACFPNRGNVRLGM